MLIWLSGLLIVFADAEPGPSLSEVVRIGCFFGSLFGQTTLAAAWAAFGLGKLIWRVPFALLWMMLLAGLAASELDANDWGSAARALMWCLGGQWLILQLPLWLLALRWGFRLRHVEDTAPLFDPRQVQFGIRQLLILTTFLGVIFGIGRLVVTHVRVPFDLETGDEPIFIFLTLAGLILSLPLLLAALSKQKALLMTTLTCVLIGVTTGFESLLLESLGIGPGPELPDFIAINAVTVATILAVTAVVRWDGYRITKAAPELAQG